MNNNIAMPYHQLGKSSLKISRIGFGCMSIKPNQPDLKNLIDTAIYNGINYFDTADIYDDGLNETSMGIALKDKRKQVIIATKVGNKVRQDRTGLDWDPSKKHIITAVEKSLKRLQTDYIDLYQLHGGTIEDKIDDTIEAFETLQQQGKIRYYGISSIRPNVIREYVKRSNIVSVMMQYSLLDRRPEESCLELLKQKNIGVLTRGSIAGGLLAGKQAKPYLNYSSAQVTAAANAIKLSTPQNGNSAATAIGFALKNAAITGAVVGIRTLEQLHETLHVLNKKDQAEEKIQILEQVVEVNYYDSHR